MKILKNKNLISMWFAFLFLSLSACVVDRKQYRKGRNQDILNRFSGKLLFAEKYLGYTRKKDSTQKDSLTVGTLKLRKNGSFALKQKLSIMKISYYSGHYSTHNDTIQLTYGKDQRKDTLKHRKLVFDKIEGKDVVRFEDGYYFNILKNKFQ